MLLLSYQAAPQGPSMKRKMYIQHRSPFISSVGGVHCVDVAVQLVSKRQPGLGGEIYLGATTQAS